MQYFRLKRLTPIAYVKEIENLKNHTHIHI